MKGYPRKTCKKAKAASLSLLCHGEDGLGALCEGVGGETCYPVAHKLRRPGRGFCGDPQIGDAGEITIVSSSARRALQASLIFGTPCPYRPGGPHGPHGQHGPASASRLLASELSAAPPPRPPDLEGDAPRDVPGKDKQCRPEDVAGMEGHGLGHGLGHGQGGVAEAGATADGGRGFWGRVRLRLQRGACCLEPSRTTSTPREAPARR